MRVTLDDKGSMCVYLVGGASVAKTEELVPDQVFVDKSEDGQVVGIEIIGVELEGGSMGAEGQDTGILQGLRIA